ncbi:Glu-tRNA(Gln) amidotransferase subunit GatE [Candidatus Woesearchaeota archaeon]|nr:Glu-tRNA(Gln) amidotransferase subunit GatE [Candidatus Woesearchaeota archaeon]
MNYKDLGFKCGIEVHQRLQSHKLFCNCPSILRDDTPDITIKRKLRAVAGETGNIDIAAKHAMEKSQEFIYEFYTDTNCLVEIDDEPPHKLNEDALNIALEIALLLKCEIVEDINFMRKTIIDGSNTTGFQRTALVARNGFIETSRGDVRIESIYLEEESAKNVRESIDNRTWRLDRLGIPLVEIQTYTDILDEKHAKETAEKIGMILRSTDKVMRGIGSIRQDVNVSITGHPRVEIKGFQDIRLIEIVIKKEVERQLNSINTKKDLLGHVRNVKPDGSTEFLRPLPGASRMYPETDVPIFLISKQRIKSLILPEIITEKILRFESQYKLSPEISSLIVKENPSLFENFANKFRNLDPSLIAKTMTLTLSDLKSRYNLEISKLNDEDLKELFSLVNSKKIYQSLISQYLKDKIEGNKIDLSNYKVMDDIELEKMIIEIIKQNKNSSINALMGIIMDKIKGKANGKKVMELLRKHYIN